VAIVTVEELERILEVGEERAELLVELATRVVASALYPNEIPDAPEPAPMRDVGLRVAIRLNRSTPDTSGAVISESIGSYTYRLAAALALDGALRLTDDEAKDLGPWLPVGGRRVYDVSVTGHNRGRSSSSAEVAVPSTLGPAFEFERDLDHPDDELASDRPAAVLP
jgi:hypothetical protein